MLSPPKRAAFKSDPGTDLPLCLLGNFTEQIQGTLQPRKKKIWKNVVGQSARYSDVAVCDSFGLVEKIECNRTNWLKAEETVFACQMCLLGVS